MDVDIGLFSDAKPRKHRAEDFVGGYFAEDFAEVVEGFADVLADKVGRDAGGNAVADAGQGVGGAAEGFYVAQVGDNDIVGCRRIFRAQADKCMTQRIHSVSGLCGKEDGREVYDTVSGTGVIDYRDYFADEAGVLGIRAA